LVRQPKAFGRRGSRRNSPDAGRRNAMQEWEVPLIAPPWCCGGLPAGGCHSGSVGRLYQPIRQITIAPRFSFHPSRLTFTPWLASMAASPWLEGTRLAEPAAAAPNAGWTGCALVGKGNWNAAFRAAAWCLLGLLGVGAGGLGGASCQPLHPQKTTASVRGVLVLPGGASLAQHERFGGRRSAGGGRRKSGAESATSTPAAPSAESAPNRGIFFLRLQRWSSGNAQRNSNEASPNGWGRPCAETDPRAHGAAECSLPPWGIFSSEGG